MSRVQPLVLSVEDGRVLRGWTRSSSLPAALAQRARILVLAADGHSNVEISRRVGVSLPTVRAWRDRYRTGGMAALGDLPRSGRLVVHDENSIVAATLDPPPAHLGVTHWSARLLGAQLGISFATVARIWRRWGLKPWKAETFKFSTDPELEAKIRDVVGLYVDPPERAVVVCVDEKTQIQALDRTAPMLPIRPGIPEKQTHDYKRNGTTPPCSPPWRSRPAWSRTAVTSGTPTPSSSTSSSTSRECTHGCHCTSSATTTPPISIPM